MAREGSLVKMPNMAIRILRKQEELWNSMTLLRLMEGFEGQVEIRRQRGPQDRTILNAAKVKLLIEHKGLSQRTACDLVGMARSTYRKHKDDPEVRAQMEDLKLDPEIKAELSL